MSKSIINFILDVILAVFFLAMLWTQFILRFLFPAPAAAAGWRLWGLDFDDWNWLSFGLTFIFAVLVLVHVMLHWSWVCGIVTHRLAKYAGRNWSSNPSTETLVGVAILVALLHILGGFYLAAMMTIRPPTDSALPPSNPVQRADQEVHQADGPGKSRTVQFAAISSVK